nr:Chain B, Zinc finger protein 831 [Homo sapiens]8FUF_D Chain D, Zinc finger protein 831 [Homo sapiens]8FUF_F Chain F, Zinc finger protein 831 [Homo sapiens]8FUF_H Chain H, Zinc finger protein 831 [Homo sapiens]
NAFSPKYLLRLPQ